MFWLYICNYVAIAYFHKCETNFSHQPNHYMIYNTLCCIYKLMYEKMLKNGHIDDLEKYIIYIINVSKKQAWDNL
jgi:hypothetical protein